MKAPRNEREAHAALMLSGDSKMSQQWESSHTQKALLMRANGASYNTIAKALGFSKNSVIYRIKQADTNHTPARSIMSDSEIEQLRNMMDEGYGSRAICIALGRSFNTIKDHAREYRASKCIVLPKRFEWTDERKQRAIMLRNQGNTHREIAADLGCSRMSASGFLGNQQRKAQQQTEIVQEPVQIVQQRTIMNSTMREPLPKGGWVPTRPGAMDYLACKSSGIA